MSRCTIEPENNIYKEYVKLKREFDILKKSEGELKDKIKTKLLNDNLDNYEDTDFIITLTTTKREELDETKAIQNLKSNLDAEILNAVIHTREYIDETKLQELIYEGLVDGNILKDCIIEKEPTYTLRVKNKK